METMFLVKSKFQTQTMCILYQGAIIPNLIQIHLVVKEKNIFHIYYFLSIISVDKDGR